MANTEPLKRVFTQLTIIMKMHVICPFMQIRLIFIKKVLHEDLLQNRGKRPLGNGLLNQSKLQAFNNCSWCEGGKKRVSELQLVLVSPLIEWKSGMALTLTRKL